MNSQSDFDLVAHKHYLEFPINEKMIPMLTCPIVYLWVLAGLLKCSTFSYVTLDGTEVSRFTVPSMKGGVLISANRQGHLIISDVVKSSVFIIIDSHVHLEIKDQEFLKACRLLVSLL